MDASFKIIITIFILSFAATTTASQKPHFKNTHEEKVLHFTYSKLKRLTHLLENKTTARACTRKNTTLPKTIFKNLKLAKDEQRISLLYFSHHAQNKCIEKVIIALAQFKELEKRYRGKNIIETTYDLDILCCVVWEGQAEIEMAYHKISPKLRKKLESNPKLQKPFNPVSPADSLGL